MNTFLKHGTSFTPMQFALIGASILLVVVSLLGLRELLTAFSNPLAETKSQTDAFTNTTLSIAENQSAQNAAAQSTSPRVQLSSFRAHSTGSSPTMVFAIGALIIAVCLWLLWQTHQS
jgi:hypothetical protein